MTASANIYAHAIFNAFSAGLSWANGSVKMALLGSGYTPNLATDAQWSDISSSEVTGTGYSAGGTALTTVTKTMTAANSWGTSWASGTSYSQGSIVRPATGNGFLYYAEAGGVSSGATPTWPTTIGATVVDNTVTWTCVGKNLVQFFSGSAAWASSTIANAANAVIYGVDPGATPSNPLIAVMSFGVTVSTSSSTLTVQEPTLGWFWIAV